jgi:hypothetical protein
MSATIGNMWPVFETATNEKVFRETEPIILPPNTGLAITGSSDNVNVRGSFRWRERSVEPMEMQSVNPRLR